MEKSRDGLRRLFICLIEQFADFACELVLGERLVQE
jgi:hypothetical protein